MDGSHRRVPPKLIELLGLLEEHSEQIEYDLQAYHQIELAGLWTGSLSWRRLGVLVRHLPTESATKTALRNAAPTEVLTKAVEDPNAAYGAWSQTDMLLAELIDVAHWLRWSKTTDAEKQINVPKPFPRPGVQRDPNSVAPANNENVVNLLEYIRAHNGASPEGFTKV